MKKLLQEGEEKKKLAELVAEGFIDEAVIEGQGKKIEEESERNRREKKYVIVIADITIDVNFPTIICNLTNECDCEIEEELSGYDPEQ
jgi:hypothetical protein